MPLRARWALAAVLIVGLVILDLTSRKLPVPQRDQLIPQEVFHEGMPLGLFRFGVEYGTGWRTLIPSAGPYVVARALLAANRPWWQAVLVGAAFGAARAATALQLILAGGDGLTTALAAHRRVLERLATVVAAACGGAAVL